MIIWINGAFGSGKTQAAYELHRRIQNAYVYDPEHAGDFIRRNLPQSICAGDFQDYPMWRSVNLEMLAYIASHYTGIIIVPMTITNREYYEEIVVALSRKHDVKHVILCAKKETIIKRLASRFDGPHSWAAQQIDRCIAAFDKDITVHKIHTDNMNVYQVVAEIARYANVPLSEDKRSNLHKLIDRIITQYRHIHIR